MTSERTKGDQGGDDVIVPGHVLTLGPPPLGINSAPHIERLETPALTDIQVADCEGARRSH